MFKLGFDLYTGFQFWTTFKLLKLNSTYTRGDLYASIYGKYLYLELIQTPNNQKHLITRLLLV